MTQEVNQTYTALGRGSLRTVMDAVRSYCGEDWRSGRLQLVQWAQLVRNIALETWCWRGFQLPSSTKSHASLNNTVKLLVHSAGLGQNGFFAILSGLNRQL